MNYADAIRDLGDSKIDLGAVYAIPSGGEGHSLTPYEITDITISTLDKLGEVKSEILKGYSREDALKRLNLIENDDLDIFLTFQYTGRALKEMTLSEYLHFLKDSII